MIRGWGGTVNEDNKRAWEHWLRIGSGEKTVVLRLLTRLAGLA